MHKQDAIAALKEGKKIAHKHFTSDEWVREDGNLYEFEDGCRCSIFEFWNWRREDSWLSGWYIFVEPLEMGTRTQRG